MSGSLFGVSTCPMGLKMAIMLCSGWYDRLQDTR